MGLSRRHPLFRAAQSFKPLIYLSSGSGDFRCVEDGAVAENLAGDGFGLEALVGLELRGEIRVRYARGWSPALGLTRSRGNIV